MSSPTTLPGILTPLNSNNISVAAYSNSDPTNATSDWLPVIVCKSQIGASTTPNCRDVNIITDSTTICFVRLDIQIAYTNIGSIFNPQRVLSAVIYYYQYLVSESFFKSLISSFIFTLTGNLSDIAGNFTCNGKCYFSRYIEHTYYRTRSNPNTEYSFTI